MLHNNNNFNSSGSFLTGSIKEQLLKNNDALRVYILILRDMPYLSPVGKVRLNELLHFAQQHNISINPENNTPHKHHNKHLAHAFSHNTGKAKHTKINSYDTPRQKHNRYVRKLHEDAKREYRINHQNPHRD